VRERRRTEEKHKWVMEVPTKGKCTHTCNESKAYVFQCQQLVVVEHQLSEAIDY
jgi:hypothetical protein